MFLPIWFYRFIAPRKCVHIISYPAGLFELVFIICNSQLPDGETRRKAHLYEISGCLKAMKGKVLYAIALPINCMYESVSMDWPGVI